MMRTKILADSFKQIMSFSEARTMTYGNDKLVGSSDLMRMVR